MRIPRAAYRLGWALDRLADRLSGGRCDTLRPGPPTLRLATIGRRSGERRENALYYLEVDGSYAVVASNAGSDRDPAWWQNLQQWPETTVRVDGRRIAIRARRATPIEESALWPRLEAMFGRYREYRAMATRPIPIVLLERGEERPAPR